ncbi:phosphoribosylamine--glycine ligase [Candidatus Peregrinibacteria bacterium]|nr:phosphoribosylamine--glycine ligase [Candidatus Peregrinibacteria bacterium]
MKKILLVGNGAREHVIAETLKRSPQEVELYVFATANNPGIKKLAKEYRIVKSLSDFDSLKKFASDVKPDFAFVGPDNPIADGAVDALLEVGVRSVAPLKVCAQLESSKSFTRELLAKYGIPGSPKFKVFTATGGIREFIEELGEYVIKADGLTGGKGVKVSGEHLQSFDEGYEYAAECLNADGRVVVEEKFIGVEFSLMSFVDGIHVVDMPAVQDHKRAHDGDTGPNTGGMGSYSPLPFLRPGDLETAHAITVKVAEAIHKETGKYFKGIMYGGFMAVKNGVGLIEYNARFGDPEVMNVLPLLKSDFVDVCERIIGGNLERVEFENKATVLKYIVPEGYPDNPRKGEKIVVGEIPAGVKMYYGSVDQKEDGLYLSSSRALAFVGIADTIKAAEKLAQSAVGSVKGRVFYRKDIGTKELIQKRIDLMRSL